MSCACENARMSREIDRYRRLAKAWARIEGQTAVIYRNADGTLDFASIKDSENKVIIEYITPY